MGLKRPDIVPDLKFLLYVPFFDEGLKEVVVGVVERHVDVASVRDASDAVHKDEASVRARLGPVGW